MTGLEKILTQIAEESAEVCNEKMLKAKEEAKKFLAESNDKANTKAKHIDEETEEKVKLINSAAKTKVDAYTRTKYLEVKNAVVNDVIAAAYEEIIMFTDEKYFDFLYRICLKYIEPGECVMYFSKKDLERLPSDFEDRINGEVFEKAAVHVSEKPAKIYAGFLLVYDDFEINCSLKALFEEKIDFLKDSISEMLFTEQKHWGF